MIANKVSPIDVPNCATVLNTAPAKPWVFGEKESAIIKFATVKMAKYDLKKDLLAYSVINIRFWEDSSMIDASYHLQTAVLEAWPRKRNTTMTNLD